MRPLLLIILLTGVSRSQAQFAYISDKDGNANIRKSPTTGNNLLTTLPNGHLVYLLETNGNWTNILFTKNGRQQTGYIFNDRVKIIAGYHNIPIIEDDAHNVLCQKDSVKVLVSTQPFNKEKYRLTYSKDNPDLLESINGKHGWGVDGYLPTAEYKSIQIQIGKRKTSLPPVALSNLFEPSLSNTRVQYDHRKDILYIESVNSEGAGNYMMMLKVERGVFSEKLTTYGE